MDHLPRGRNDQIGPVTRVGGGLWLRNETLREPRLQLQRRARHAAVENVPVADRDAGQPPAPTPYSARFDQYVLPNRSSTNLPNSDATAGF